MLRKLYKIDIWKGDYMNILLFSESNKTPYFMLPVRANYTFVRKGIHTAYHIHPVYHLMFVTDGQGVVENSINAFPVKENDIVIINPNEKHILSSDYKTGLTYFTFNFYFIPYRGMTVLNTCSKWHCEDSGSEILSLAETERLDRLFDFNTSNIYIKYDRHRWKDIISLVQSFSDTSKIYYEEYYERIIKKSIIESPEYRKHYFNTFIQTFWRFYTIVSLPKKTIPGNRAEDTLLSSIINYLEDKVYEKYSLKELSSRLKYNPIYLCNYFKQKTGVTINRYYNRLKIIKACKYLRTTNKMITEISSLLGFSSPNHFSSNFKKEKKISPREYKKQLEID